MSVLHACMSVLRACINVLHACINVLHACISVLLSPRLSIAFYVRLCVCPWIEYFGNECV